MRRNVLLSKSDFITRFEPLKPKLESFAVYLAGNREDAKDIVAETVMIAYERIESLQSDKALLSFLLTIARRVNIEKYRRSQKIKLVDIIEFDRVYSEAESPEQILAVKELYKALAEIDSDKAEALILAEIKGFSHKEIALAQQCSVANIKVKIYRAKKQLAKLLDAAPQNKKHKKYTNALSNLRGLL